ncbi:MAG: tetratricopeptide repeat-containing serine protease family protein [Candidatus Binatia bacterium]|nr:tetratricopeptide repeat-containing serine protease family protein [Candidatus Binatia bacterium]
MKTLITSLCASMIFVVNSQPCTATAVPASVQAVLSDSAVVVEVYSVNHKRIGHGSGVIVSPSEVITNCHVLRRGRHYRVRYRAEDHQGELLYADVARDLCSIQVRSLGGIPAKLGSTAAVREGDSVYTVAAPKIPELVIHSGKVEALRETSNGFYIRTSAFASTGSSGGGVFTAEGKLIGIIAFGPTASREREEVQPRTFAPPVEWIELIPRRSVGTKLYTTRTQYDYMTIIDDLKAKMKWQELIAFSDGWLSTQPDYPATWIANNAKAYSMFEMGKLLQALATYQKVVAIEPLDDSAWNNMGNVHAALMQYDVAIISYERAAALSTAPKATAATYANIGIVYNRKGETDSARKAYEHAVRLNPDAAEALRNLGIAWTQLGNPAAGLPFIERAIKITPYDPQAWLGLALAHHIRGDQQGCAKALKRLQELSPELANKSSQALSCKTK